jgi:6-phosphogluconate dehydrogenase
VLERKDDQFDPKRDLLDMILDTAEQKGTGRWTAEAAFELGVPSYLISQSVFARVLSGYKVPMRCRMRDAQSLVGGLTPASTGPARQGLEGPYRTRALDSR